MTAATSQTENGPDRLPLVLGFYVVLGAIALGWMGWRGDPIGWAMVGQEVPLVVGGLAGLISGLSVDPIATRWLYPTKWVGALKVEILDLLGPLTPARIVAVAVFSAAGEELLFRGALVPAVGILPGAVIFGMLHGGFSRHLMGWALFAGIAGIGLGGLMFWTGGLLSPFLAHAAVNGAALWRLSREPSVPHESTAVRSIDENAGF